MDCLDLVLMICYTRVIELVVSCDIGEMLDNGEDFSSLPLYCHLIPIKLLYHMYWKLHFSHPSSLEILRFLQNYSSLINAFSLFPPHSTCSLFLFCSLSLSLNYMKFCKPESVNYCNKILDSSTAVNVLQTFFIVKSQKHICIHSCIWLPRF